MEVNKQIFIAWTTFQRRQVSMQSFFGFDICFLPVKHGNSLIGKLYSYLINSSITLKRLVEQRPDVVWIQLPQVPLLWVALFYRNVFNRRALVIADCHNSMFRPPWSNIPYGIACLAMCDMVLAHNTAIAEKAAALGVPRARTLVVEDPPAQLYVENNLPLPFDCTGPLLVFPASYAEDEPIEELLAAAHLVPDINIVVTGGTEKKRQKILERLPPKNVHFTGYLPRSIFENLLDKCDAVIALTRLKDVQLSVCGEAAGAGKPMLLANSPLLSRLYPVGTVLVDVGNPEFIAAGMRELVIRKETLAIEMTRFKEDLCSRWMSQCGDKVNANIANRRYLQGKTRVHV